MGERVYDRNIGARTELKVVRCADMGRLHKVNAARVDDNQFRALTQTLLHARGKDGMSVGGIGAD